MPAPPPASKHGGSSSNEALRKAGKEFARKEIDKTFAKSKILDNSINFPKFSKDELSLGKILGKGGFGTVYEVRGFSAWAKPTGLKRGTSLAKGTQDDEEVLDGEMENRNFISKHCIRNGGDSRYAVKFLSKEVVDDPPTFIQAISDMAIETRVLSDIQHPNIIKMRALAQDDPFQEKYFLVMDRLYDTLEKRIAQWDKRTKRFSGLTASILDRSGEKKKSILEEKLVSAFDLSAALDYLHRRNILYRDLKPENIGYDIRGDIKIFDFGLAKELHDEDKDANDLFKLTGMTGSPRYMAPEVGMEMPYNAKCDTYSFAILFWQMYSAKVPFEVYTVRALKERVWCANGKRPFIEESWAVPIKTLLRRSWSGNVNERPTMEQVNIILRSECVRCRDGDDSGLEHQRRRSTFVYRGARGTLSSIKSTE